MGNVTGVSTFAQDMAAKNLSCNISKGAVIPADENNPTKPKVQLSFHLDGSNMVQLTKAEAICEYFEMVEEQVEVVLNTTETNVTAANATNSTDEEGDEKADDKKQEAAPDDDAGAGAAINGTNDTNGTDINETEADTRVFETVVKKVKKSHRVLLKTATVNKLGEATGLSQRPMTQDEIDESKAMV